jgi:hypothetical protein
MARSLPPLPAPTVPEFVQNVMGPTWRSFWLNLMSYLQGIGSVGTLTAYSAGFDITGYALATDVFAIKGSATKTVKIWLIAINGQATGNDQIDLILVKRSTANSGGTPTTISAVPMDSANPAATAALVKYGAAPTLGTIVPGEVRDTQLSLPSVGLLAFSSSTVIWEFGTRGGQPLTLNGANEVLALNFQGVSPPAGMNLSVTIEWTEE